MSPTLTALVMAAEDPITDSGLFGIVQTFFRGVGVILIIYVIFSVAKNLLAGKPAAAAKTVIGGFLVAAILFNLLIPINLVKGMGNLVSGVGDLIQDVTNSGGPSSGSTSGSGTSGSGIAQNTDWTVGGAEVGCDYPMNPGC